MNRPAPSDARLIELFLDMLAAEQGAGDNTLSAYRSDLEDLAGFLVRKRQSFVSAETQTLRDYLSDLDERGFKSSSVARRLSSTRHLFRFLLNERTRSDDPAAILSGPKRGRGLRPAALIYGGIVLVLAVGLGIAFHNRESISVELLRARGEPFTNGAEGSIVNRFELEINNEHATPITVELEAPATLPVRVVTAIRPFPVAAGKTSRLEFFAEFPRDFLQSGRAAGEVMVLVHSGAQLTLIKKEMPLVGPIQ